MDARHVRTTGGGDPEPTRLGRPGRSPLLPQGSLGSGPSSVVSVHLRLLRPHSPVSRAHRDFAARRLRRDAFAVRERLGDPRDLPRFATVISTRAVDPTPVGPPRSPVVPAGGVPGFLVLSASRHPRPPSLPAIPDGLKSRRCIRSLHATARVFALPSRLATTRQVSRVHLLAFRGLRHPRFSRRASPRGAGGQARWPNGKPATIGTFTRSVTAASGAAR